MGKEERELTKKESERKEKFEKICSEMEQKGFERKDLTVGIMKANIMALIVMLPFVAVLGWIYAIVNPGALFGGNGDITVLALLSLIVLVVLHELIHGITWGIFAKSHFAAIDFGIIWKAMTPYCTCSEPLNKWQYVLGAAMPTVILGFGLAAIAINMNHFPLFLIAEIMVFAGGGDFFMILKILLYRTNSKETVYYDHPYECGGVVFEKKR